MKRSGIVQGGCVGVVAIIAALGGGCGFLGSIVGGLLPGGRNMTVELINETGFATEVRLFYGDNQNAFDFELTTFGEEFTTTLAASGTGASTSFIQSCDDLQAIIIDRAEAQVPLVTPDADTGVLRDTTDFACGDVLTFRFVLDDSLVPDLRIVFSAAPN